MPSRMSSLLATCLYSDIASTRSTWPSLRIETDSRPPSSARRMAARRTRSRLSGLRRVAVRAGGVSGFVIRSSPRLDRLTV